jgi:hypothetical protein
MTKICSILDRSSIFDRWQKLVGAEDAKQWFLKAHVLRWMPIRVMEVGCATDALCRYLPSNVQYVGVDIDEGYVAAVRHGLPDRVFQHADVGDPITFEALPERSDLIIAFGLLCHLDGDQVRRCLEGCVGVLGNARTFLSVNPCYGQHVRPLEYLTKHFD